MADYLATISSNPTLREYVQGAARSAIQPVADFLAPGVDVGSATGKYKSYDDKNRFVIPDTSRAVGGKATQLNFHKSDNTFTCEPNALDVPVDIQAQSEEDAMLEFQEAADLGAQVGAMSHEKTVIDLALSTLGAGTDLTWNSSADPVDDLDTYIQNVLLAANFGSSMEVRVLFGPGAWQIFKNQSAVRGRFVVGAGGSKGVGFAVPNEQIAGQLLMGNPSIRTSFMAYDSAKQGQTASKAFMLDASIIVFAALQNPTRYDPSFMKTFRLRNRWMVPGSYESEDGRSQIAKLDWSEDVAATNSSAAVRLNVATS